MTESPETLDAPTDDEDTQDDDAFLGESPDVRREDLTP